MSEQNGFKQWCVVELFGHQVIAGMVTEQQIGGQSFVRVDVPATDGRDAYTKLYGTGAIYAITPTNEETCRKAIANFTQPPIAEYHFRQTVPQIRDSRPHGDEGWDDDD